MDTISPEARKEILNRLLALNYKIHEEMVVGLWEKKSKKVEKTSPVKPAGDEGQEKLEL